MKRAGQPGPSRGLIALCILVAAVVATPIIIAVVQAFQGGFSAARASFTAGATRTLMLHSLEVAVVATPLAVVLGVTCAWFVERTRLPGRTIWAVLFVAPLTIPPFVTSYSWANVSTWLQSYYGAVGIIAFVYFPIVYLLVAVALRGLDPALEETARSLGLSGTRTFFRVVLPQLRPAILGGALLVALDTFVEYDAFVALKFQAFSANVYAQYQLGFSASGAAALSLTSIAVCLILVFGEARLRGHANYTRVSQGARRALEPYALKRATIPVMLVLGAIVAISVGIPVVTLTEWFARSSDVGVENASANLQYLLPATRTSVELGVAAAVVGVALALPIAFAATRYRGPIVTICERATYLSFALPDLVGAIALAYAASHYAHFLYGSMTLLILAEAVLFAPFAVVALRATFGQIERSLEDSARSLGAGPLSSFWRVTLPLARPGLVAAAVLMFAFTLGDLPSAQVLLPLSSYTLGTEFQANSSTVAFAAAAPFAAMLILLAFGAAYLLMTRFGRVRSVADR